MVLFKGNGLTVTEKENKKGITLAFKYDKSYDPEEIDLDLKVNSHDNIQLVFGSMPLGVFGYSSREIKDKNVNFSKHKVSKTKRGVKIFIPFNKKGKKNE